MTNCVDESTVADPGGGGSRRIAPVFKLIEKRWQLCLTTSFVSPQTLPWTNFWILY